MVEHRGVNYGFIFGKGEPIFVGPAYMEFYDGLSFGFKSHDEYVPPAVPSTYAEPPDDLVVHCKNCGAEIELISSYEGFEWEHKALAGEYLGNMECAPNTIVVEEKNDESCRTDPGSSGQEEGAPEPGTGGGERGPRQIPALLPEEGDRG